MTLPTKVGELLGRGDVSSLPGTLNAQDQCEGSRFHSPTPLLVRRVFLIPESWPGGSLMETDEVSLCSVCADNLAVFQHLLLQTGGVMEWEVRREFGNMIRALAQRSWKQYVKQQVGVNG